MIKVPSMSEPLLMKNQYVIGIDLGGTKICAALVDSNGNVVGEAAFRPTEATKPPAVIVDNIVEAASRALRSERATLDQIGGIGIGIPTVLDETGACCYSDGIPTLTGFNIGKALTDKLGLTVYQDNDANCFALGEVRYGAGAGARVFCGVTLGTGVGIGIIIEGKVFRGAWGGAGEIWVSPYKEGIVEDHVSGRGLSETYRELSGMTIEARAIEERARLGDEKAKKTWEIFGEDLGYVLCYLVNILNPDVLVVGGSISNAMDLFYGPVERMIRKHTAENKRVKILKGKLGALAGVIGAAALISTGSG
jgi:glucokinase